MADIALTIQVSSVEYTSWLRTSYIASSQISEAGIPMIEQYELGPDQKDAFDNFMEESTREVSKLIVSRQADVDDGFEYNGNEVVYHYFEYEPVLRQADVLKSQLNEDVKNAIFSYLSILWFNTKGNQDAVKYFRDRYEKLASNIDRTLYILHD